jgi:hypothetical protein
VSPQPRRAFDPRSILASLERSGTNYIVIGGLARVLRGVDETTTGLDISPGLTADNIERLKRALAELNAARPDGFELTLTEHTLGREPFIELSTPFGELNMVSQPAGVPRGFVALRGAATKENLGQGLQPYIASAGDLAAMAAALHRDEDLVRLPVLRRIMELEVDRRQTIGPPVPPPSRSQTSRSPNRRTPKLAP